MAITADQERVKSLLMETITMLCKNGLHYNHELTIEGLIGITIDRNSVVLINIKETVENIPFNHPNADKGFTESLKSKRKKMQNNDLNPSDAFHYEPPNKIAQMDLLDNSLDMSSDRNFLDKTVLGLMQTQTISSLETSTSSKQFTNHFDNSDNSDQEFSTPIKDEYTLSKETKELDHMNLLSNQSFAPNLDHFSGQLDSSFLQLCTDFSSQHFKHWQNMQQRPHNPVEMIPGTGVYINADTYEMFLRQNDVSASRLVRRVVREVFPDLILASSCCLGTGQSHAGLDHHKVKTIKAFVQQRIPGMSHTEIVSVINECCRDIRAKFRRHLTRHKEKEIEKTLSEEIAVKTVEPLLKFEPQ